MKKILVLIFLAAGTLSAAEAQTRRRPVASSTPSGVPAKPAVDKGKVSGRTYTNPTFRFEVTFPDSWLIPGDDFEAYMKSQGYDLTLKAPTTLDPTTRSKVNRALQKVTTLLTAYRSMPGMSDNAILRISAEDLSATPQIEDAVDYFDAMRSTFASVTLPPGFKYSETQAEKLGAQQFAYIDVIASDGKKRMYATVRNGYAILFTLTYSKIEDLNTFRSVLEDGNFSLK